MESKFEKKTHILTDEEKHKVHRLSRIMTVFGLLVLIASFSGIPFPFSRILWIKSLLGVSGLINCGLFVLVAKGIRRFSLPALFASMGILVYEQGITWVSFLTYSENSPVRWQDWTSLAVSLGTTLFLLITILPVIKPIMTHAKALPRKIYITQHLLISEKKWQLQTEALIVNLIVYAVFFIAAWEAPRVLPLEFHYAAFKVLCEAVCVISFMGVAQEIEFYLEEIQPKLFCAVKVLTHILTAAAFFYLLLHRMPFERFVIPT